MSAWRALRFGTTGLHQGRSTAGTADASVVADVRARARVPTGRVSASSTPNGSPGRASPPGGRFCTVIAPTTLPTFLRLRKHLRHRSPALPLANAPRPPATEDRRRRGWPGWFIGDDAVGLGTRAEMLGDRGEPGVSRWVSGGRQCARLAA